MAKETQELSSGGASQTASLFKALPSVVTSIGYPEFSTKLFEALRAVAETEYITVFISGREARARLLVAENLGNPGDCRKSATLYLERYWNFDPANTAIDRDRSNLGIWYLHIKANDLPSTEHRGACYHALGLAERFSLIQSRGEETMRVNLYYHSRADGAKTCFEQVTEYAPLLMAAIWRHYDCVASFDRSDVHDTFRNRLERAAPSLSRREREVCTFIAAGLTSEGIAIELGVRMNTVLTYRKRAYARLGISSQNELMRFLMKSEAAPQI
jgi:DNA-binding CsgD family transcriptional regulator